MRLGSAVQQLNGPGLRVVGLDEAVDRSLQFDDRAEHAALEPPPGELGEKVSMAFSHEQRSGEVEREPRMAGEPGADLGVLVGAVVVEDHVDHLAGRHGSSIACRKRMNS